MTLSIDLLYIEDCQDWRNADQILRQVLADLGIEAAINYWLVRTDRQAIEFDFRGSPEIRVNDEALFQSKGIAAGMHLRSYITEEGVLGYPTYRMLYDALLPFV